MDLQPISIVIVEDDKAIAAFLQTLLQREGFVTEVVDNGRLALNHIQKNPPHLVLLDLMLPGMDGLELCQAIRRSAPYIPIIMVTAKDEDVDKIVGLELGADDYITKPFKGRELLARVRAVLRLAQSRGEAAKNSLCYGELEIDLNGRSVTRANQPIKLTPKEFDLLALMAANPGRVFGRDMLLERIWGYDYGGESRTVDVHIQRLRQKIEPDSHNPVYLVTVHHIGYKFEA